MDTDLTTVQLRDLSENQIVELRQWALDHALHAVSLSGVAVNYDDIEGLANAAVTYVITGHLPAVTQHQQQPHDPTPPQSPHPDPVPTQAEAAEPMDMRDLVRSRE